ncbi:hypothetical protein [Shimia sp. Alg240-R146]|nr:hypothetical protein [Shimia sp. Alg240-R146]
MSSIAAAQLSHCGHSSVAHHFHQGNDGSADKLGIRCGVVLEG